MRVIAAFLLWTMVEIGLFVVVGGAIGVWATWGVVLGSGILGGVVIRRQGAAVRQAQVIRLEALAGPLAHGALRVLAGFLLILPGFLTDAIGLCLLIPAVREAVIFRLRDRLGARMAGRRPRDPGMIDGEAMEVVMEAERIQPPSGTSGPPSGWTKP